MKYLIVSVALLFQCIAAWGMDTTSDAAGRFRQLEQDIPSLYLVNGLFFSPEQNDQLLDLLERSGKLRQTFARDMSRMEKQYGQDLDQWADRAIRRLPKPEKVHWARSSGKLKQGMKAARDKLKEHQKDMDRLVEQAEKILTPSQWDIVAGFKPCFIPERDFREPVRVGQAAKDNQFGEEVLARLRKVPDQRLESARTRALDRLVPYLMQKRHIPYSEERKDAIYRQIADELDGVLPALREMSDVDFELDKGRLANQVLPLDTPRDDCENEEAFSHHAPASPEDIRMKVRKYLLNTGIADVIAARGTKGKTSASDKLPDVSADNHPWRAAREKRRLAGLIARLHVTREQTKDILPVLRAGTSARNKVEREITATQTEAIKAYETLRAELSAQEPMEKTERRANEYHHKVKSLYEEDLVQSVKPFEAKLDRLLSADQVALLTASRDQAGQHPPKRPRARRLEPRKIKNETRQYSERLLAKCKTMNPSEFQRNGVLLCRTFIEDSAPDQAIDVEAETDRMVAVLERARAMDRQTYSRERDELAAALCPRRSEPREIAYGAKYDRGEPLPILDASTRILFTNEAMDILAMMNSD